MAPHPEKTTLKKPSLIRVNKVAALQCTVCNSTKNEVLVRPDHSHKKRKESLSVSHDYDLTEEALKILMYPQNNLLGGRFFTLKFRV